MCVALWGSASAQFHAHRSPQGTDERGEDQAAHDAGGDDERRIQAEPATFGQEDRGRLQKAETGTGKKSARERRPAIDGCGDEQSEDDTAESARGDDEVLVRRIPSSCRP